MNKKKTSIPRIDPDWLNTRYPFDVNARCGKLEDFVLSYFKGEKKVHLVDVGAGIGANTKYYLPLLNCDQHWTLIDSDQALIDLSQETIKSWIKRLDPKFKISGKGIGFQDKGRKLEITFKHGSLFNLIKLIDTERVDLIVANAVFDLLSAKQVGEFVETLAANKIPLLTTLNYQSMRFEPHDPIGDQYINLYENHMMRSRPEGAAMGPGCVNEMIRMMKEVGGVINTGQSTWLIDSEDTKIMNYMLGFMQKAIAELITSSTEKKCFGDWLNSKYKMNSLSNLRLIVEHSDILVRFR